MDEWQISSIPKREDFYEDDRFLTSTPIPPSPEPNESDDDEHREYLNELLGPLSNQNDSDLEALSLSQILRLREQLSIEEYFKSGAAIPDLKLSPQNLFAIDSPVDSPLTGIQALDESDLQSLDDPTIYLSDTSVVPDASTALAMKIDLEHPEAFDEDFNVKRQHVIENSNYRLIIEAWRPSSIEQLVEQIRNFTRNRPTLDRLWIIFYWMARNIEYDTVPYVGKKHVDKSAEAVFRTRKAISDGYANLFQRLCDDLDLRSEKINGYSKSYVFDLCNKSSVPVDHVWNAVQINQLWYLIDVTWSVGYLESSQVFKREFNSYFFLTRTNEMIYHHFPADDRWQLLKQPIKMAQYMQMPKIWPSFFQHSLQLFSPQNILHVDLVPQQSYALVLIQSPRSVTLSSTFSLNGKEIDGGSRLVFDPRKRLYRCCFAPNSLGVHIIRILAKNETSHAFSNAIEFELNVKQLPTKVISYPKTSKLFDELHLEVLWPCNTHLIRLDHGDTHTEILIRTPIDVELLGRLTGENGMKIPGGSSTFIDRRQSVWRCLFAPPADGLFEAFILARKRLDSVSFAVTVRFKIRARRVPLPPLSYPKTWQLFHDLDLQVEIPRHSSFVPWPEFGSFAQVCIRAPEDVRLMCCLERRGIRLEKGSLTQFNREKQHWQLLFAPEQVGEHKLFIFAQCNTPDGSISGIVLEYHLDVTQLRQSIQFPVIYTTFLTKKCRIYEPLNGVLKKGTLASIHCEIPDARQVDLTVDSKWVKNEGYRNSVLKREVLVGTREVIIYAKYDENTIYNELIKYVVQ